MSDEDEEYSQLQSEMSSNEGEQEACREEIEDLGTRIERLQTAYNTLDDAKETIKDYQKNNKKTFESAKSDWKGYQADLFKKAVCEKDDSTSLKSVTTSYTDAVDSVEDSINWEIHNLRCEQNEKYGILSGLVNAWDSLCTRVRNFFN